MEFSKLPLPTDNEVADARLAHLYEILRKQEIDLRERDLLVARKLLAEMGGINEPAEDLETIVAKFARFTVEHHTKAEAKALEEELDGPTSPPPRRTEREDEGRGDSRRGRERDRGEAKPSHERGPRSRQEDRPTREPEPQPAARVEHDRGSRPQQEPDHEVRVYIGQGTAQGMTAELFANLAIEFGELQSHDVKNISIREFYGFVDLLAPKAKVLIGNLNGIQYNGLPLPVELAASLAQERGPRRGGQRDGSPRRNDGGRGRRDDNRRGGDSRRRNDRGGRRGDSREQRS